VNSCTMPEGHSLRRASAGVASPRPKCTRKLCPLPEPLPLSGTP
jgi:hypothetical protein